MAMLECFKPKKFNHFYTGTCACAYLFFITKWFVTGTSLFTCEVSCSKRQTYWFDSVIPLCFKQGGGQPFGVSGPHWKKSGLGPHIKYIATLNHKKKKSHSVLSKFTTLCWATFIAILGCVLPMDHRLYLFHFIPN